MQKCWYGVLSSCSVYMPWSVSVDFLLSICLVAIAGPLCSYTLATDAKVDVCH